MGVENFEKTGTFVFKHCNTCGKDKLIEEFYGNEPTTNGKNCQCALCQYKYETKTMRTKINSLSNILKNIFNIANPETVETILENDLKIKREKDKKKKEGKSND
jgi:hypothetical protein